MNINNNNDDVKKKIVSELCSFLSSSVIVETLRRGVVPYKKKIIPTAIVGEY